MNGSNRGEMARRLDEVYRRHADDAFRLAYAITGDLHEAHDIQQEAFVRVWSRFGDLKTEEWFTSYLLKTVVNTARSRYRRENTQRKLMERLERTQHDLSTCLPDIEASDRLISMLKTLPARQRAVAFLRYYLDLSEEETARVLETSPGAVKSLINRALKSLRIVVGTEVEMEGARSGRT